MKRLMLVLLPVLALLAGCQQKQDTYTYSSIEAGTLSGGIFTTDNGARMTVVGNERKYDISSTRRVLVSYETHPFTDPTHIDIDIRALLDAGILQPEHARSLPENPSGSPCQVTDAWFSEAYLNLLVNFTGKEADKHTFSAAYTVDEKSLTFRLGHDGSEDTEAGSETMTVFLCIPMYEPALSYEQFAQSTGQKPAYPISVLLQWSAPTLEGGPLALHERKGSYQPPVSN